MLKRALMAALALALFSCGGVRMEPMEDLTGVKEQLNLIYYVGTGKKDIARAVVLDVLGDGYEFIPEVEDYEYEILQDIAIGEALYEAKVFFRVHPFITRPAFGRILDKKGATIGYEIRPLYHPDLFKKEDVIVIHYHPGGNKQVHVDIKLEP